MANPLARIKKLSKFLSYVLGRCPDEFGLVADPDGFVDIKTLLKAIHEEEGWRHVRLAHLNETILTLTPAPMEMEANQIRAVDRSGLPQTKAPGHLPKLLYIAIRRRAYGAALQKGVHASNRSHLILSSDRDMAWRLGRRIDNDPVLLTVQVANSVSKGIRYQQYGERLYLANTIVPGTFSGPAPPKDRPESAKKKAATEPATVKTPGSYFPEPASFEAPTKKTASAKRRKEADWKKARRQDRKHKSRQQR